MVESKGMDFFSRIPFSSVYKRSYFYLFINKSQNKLGHRIRFLMIKKKRRYSQMIINMHIPDNTVSVLHTVHKLVLKTFLDAILSFLLLVIKKHTKN